jgi:hypothetical protein
VTRDLFAAQMRRMNGLRFAPADLSTHWAGLGDLPLDVLTRAVERSIRTRSDFPTPVEVRQDADLSRPTREASAQEPEDEWVTACACVATNPALARRRERATVKYAEEPPKRRR